MKKATLTLFSVVLATSFTIAQSLDDGIKFLYYGRTKSARETLEKVVAANSKDPKSIYWLGQAYLAGDDIAKSKALYQKALTDGVNDPWIWVGMGHVELLEGGDKNAARQRFDQAITTVTPTKGKNKGNPDPDILNAVGRANADGSSQQGDPAYGIEKLKQAQTLNTTDPDIDINLGKSYLKMGTGEGGQAVTAFMDATTRNPQYAAAYYRIGRIYQSQNNVEFMNEWYDKAIAADPKYGPVYLALFNYYKERDVNKAKEYLDLWLPNADKDCETDYFVADYLYRAGKNQESIAKAKEMENGACKDFVRLNIIYAYNYDKLGDSVQAKSYIDKFFTAAPADKVEPNDYVLAARLSAKFPGSEAAAAGYFEKAIAMDTAVVNKLNYMNQEAAMFAKAKMYCDQLNVLLKGAPMKPKLNSTDYFYLTKAALDCKNCTTADSISKLYVAAYPDQEQSYKFNVSAAKMCDVDTTKGLAVEPINAYNTFLMKDTAKNKKTMFNNYYYLLIYYAQYAKDLQKGVAMCDAMIGLYPDPASEENTFATSTKKQLQTALQKKGNGGGATQSKSSTGTK